MTLVGGKSCQVIEMQQRSIEAEKSEANQIIM